MFAAQLVADDTFHVFMLVAAILFAIATILAVIDRSIVMALIAAGLVFAAAAYVVVS
jgi:NADH:ubiquinone oxidoreductase subunit K